MTHGSKHEILTSRLCAWVSLSVLALPSSRLLTPPPALRLSKSLCLLFKRADFPDAQLYLITSSLGAFGSLFVEIWVVVAVCFLVIECSVVKLEWDYLIHIQGPGSVRFQGSLIPYFTSHLQSATIE